MNSRMLMPIVAATILLAACQTTPSPIPTPTSQPEPTATPVPKGQAFKIYSSLPLKGDLAAQAASVANAIDLAIEQQTDKGTLCDGVYKVTHESLDDSDPNKGGWDTFREEANAYKAAADADVMAYIGPLDSGAARVSVPIVEQASLVQLSPSSRYVGLTKPYAPSDPLAYYPAGKRNFVRLAPPEDAQGSAGAQWAGTLGLKSVFLVDDVETYGRGATAAFEAAAKSAGLQIVGRAVLDAQSTSVQTLTASIEAANAGLVYFGGGDPARAGQLLKALSAAKVDARFMGSENILTPAFVSAAGAGAAQGAYATSAGIAADKLPARGAKFMADYEARFKSKPESYAIYGYEAASVVLAAAQKTCQKDRVAILDAVYGTRDFDGALGKWSFDANGDINLIAFQGNTVDGGQWKNAGAISLP